MANSSKNASPKPPNTKSVPPAHPSLSHCAPIFLLIVSGDDFSGFVGGLDLNEGAINLSQQCRRRSFFSSSSSSRRPRRPRPRISTLRSCPRRRPRDPQSAAAASEAAAASGESTTSADPEAPQTASFWRTDTSTLRATLIRDVSALQEVICNF